MFDKDNKFGFISNNESNNNNSDIKKYIDDNTIIHPLPVYKKVESPSMIMYMVNIMDLKEYTAYGAVLDMNTTKYQRCRFIYICDDGKNKVICSTGDNLNDTTFRVSHYDTSSTLEHGNAIYSVDYTKHNTPTDVVVKITLRNYLGIYNSTEYTPEEDYNPATKKYVDDNKTVYTVSSKVLATVPAINVTLDDEITVNSININKDRRYYIEFLGSKKLCSLSIDEEIGNAITCSINNYAIEVFNDSSNISMRVTKINKDDTTNTFTNLVIYEEEVKYLDNKYLETDLTLQNSISLGRIGDIGTGSSAIGYDVEASGTFSHAEGNGTKASGNYGSHAEGDNTESSGESSHAEGVNTIASGSHSHAEGNNTKASGMSSHTEGDSTTASGDCSHAEGYNTKASSENQHVQGKFNIEDTANKYAHIVGNGKKDLISGKEVRANAHTLDWKGNGWYAGKLSQEGAPTEDKDLTTKKYVDDNAVILPLPIHTTQESTSVIVKIVNIMDLIEGVQYSTHKDPNETRTQSYRIAYVCDDGSFKLIRSLPLKNKVVHLLKVVHSTKDNYSTLSYNNMAYKVDYTKHSTNTDVEVTETLQNYLPIANITEYTPTKDYHPATKKYVDDRFICTDIIENVGIITKEEMQKCNNGTSRYVSSINFKEFFADYKYTVYQGTYGDKNILIKYDAQYNRMLTDVLDTVDKYNITLGFNLDNNYMYPFSGGASQVKSYQFTNDLVITKSAILNPSEIYSKGLREYVGTKENPVLFTEIKNGWNIVKNYYKWYAEYENSIPCGDMLVHKCPAGKNFYITYMNGAELTRYGYNATTHVVKGYNHVLSNEVLTTDNTIEYTPTADYHPTTKKYVDDKISSLPQFSFNESGELVVTINGVSKIFVPKSE